MPKENINGIELYYELLGKGEPVAFLNGVMMTVNNWLYQTSFFKKRYQCIMHDVRGQLNSEKPEQDYSMELHVEDFKALLDHLGIKKCHIVGTSYGGEIGMTFAFTYPEMVKSLSVISCASYLEKLLSFQTDSWGKAALCGDKSALFAMMHGDVYGEEFLVNNEAMLIKWEQALNALPQEFFNAFARLVKSFHKINFTSELKNIKCPTLVMVGEKDIIKLPHYSKVIADSIPNSEYITIPDAGHVVIMEKPGAVNTALFGFIQKNV